MTGILNTLLASSGISISTFNVTAASFPGAVLVGYSDGSAGTSGTGAAGSITGGSFGGKTIVEVSTINSGINCNRIRVKGFSSDPGQGWLNSITVNSVTNTGPSATYSWDATHNYATWQWSPGTWGLINGNVYNGNSVTHGG